MIKQILVPVDFSACANNALKYAGKIAQQLKAEVVLMHVYAVPIMDPAIPAATLESYLGEAEESSRKSLKKAADKFQKQFPGVTVKIKSKNGFMVSEVVDYSKRQKPGLIVMGTTGASGMEELLVGSNAASVLEKAHCPVIAVPARARYVGFQDILYTSDLTTSEAKTFHKLIDFAKIFQANITIVHVRNENETHPKINPFRFANYGKTLGYSRIRYDEITGEDVYKELNKYLNRHRFEMVAMATHHRGFFNKLFHRSLTKRMAYHTKIPLLSFRIEE